MKIRICVLWHWKVHNTKKWYALIRVIQIIMEYNDSQYYAWICLKGSSGPSEPSAQKKNLVDSPGGVDQQIWKLTTHLQLI